MVQPILELENVSLLYKSGFNFLRARKKIALESISLQVCPGDKIGILGRNGAGKSSLLKLLAGIYKPDSGTLSVTGNIRSAFIGLQHGFVPYLSGIDNIMLTGILMGMSRAEIHGKQREIIEYSEIGHNILEPIYSYSAGMKARLAFAISVFSEPDILLIDEAMSVGDRAFRKKSQEKISELIASDAAVILVSHEPGLVNNVCSKALWLEQGRIISSGDSAAVAEQYKSSFDSRIRTRSSEERKGDGSESVAGLSEGI
ncbi:ABC transporter ATP-binding protein [Biformimicrobium ophioploci]|nr:ABC transporter ATP-binding protein [Microbulbifer sp. NKW57]